MFILWLTITYPIYYSKVFQQHFSSSMWLLAFSTHSQNSRDFPGTALRKENKKLADHYKTVPCYYMPLFHILT